MARLNSMRLEYHPTMSALALGAEEVSLAVGREYTLFAEGDCDELAAFYTCVCFTGAGYLFGHRKSDLSDGAHRVFAGQFTLRSEEDSARLRELLAGLDLRGISWRVS